MLNNNGPGQNDAYQGLNGYNYGQGVNGPQAGFGQHQKRAGVMQQSMQPPLGNARQVAPGGRNAGMQRQFPQQYPATRGIGPQATGGMAALPNLRQGQTGMGGQFGNPGMVSRMNNAGNAALGMARGMGQGNQHPSQVDQLFGFANGQSSQFPAQTPQGGQQDRLRAQELHLLHGAQQTQARAFPTQALAGHQKYAASQQANAQQNQQPQDLGALMRQQQQQQQQQPQQQQQQFRNANPQAMGPAGTAAARRVLNMPGQRGEGGADKDGVLNSNDFPALGGGNRGAVNGQIGGLAGALNNMQIAPGGLNAQSGKLDDASFPALMGQQVHGGANALSMRMGVPDATQRAFQADDFSARGGGGGAASAAAAMDAAEQFTMKGLLPLLRQDDLDRNLMSLGLDLSALGHMATSGSLHTMLMSPWVTGEHISPPELRVPASFVHEAPQLNAQILSRWNVSSLLYAFYAFAGDERQLLAACALCDRGWHFHKTLHMWVRGTSTKKVKDASGNVGEQGSFEIFDPANWSMQTKESFFLDPRCIEDRPDAWMGEGRAR